MVAAPLARRGVLNVEDKIKKKRKMVKSFRRDKEAAMEFYKMLCAEDPTADVVVMSEEWYGDGGAGYRYVVVVNGSDD